MQFAAVNKRFRYVEMCEWPTRAYCRYAQQSTCCNERKIPSWYSFRHL